MATEKFTVQQVEDALRKGSGIAAAAAKILKCSPNTVRNYQKRYAKLDKVIEDITNTNLDIAEAALLKAIQDGQAWAVCFYLKCKGKDRGWSERVAVTNPDGSNLVPQQAVIVEIPANGRDERVEPPKPAKRRGRG